MGAALSQALLGLGGAQRGDTRPQLLGDPRLRSVGTPSPRSPPPPGEKGLDPGESSP